MKVISIVIFVLSTYILGSCSGFKMSSSDFIPTHVLESGVTYPVMSSGLKPGEINDLLYLGTASNISLIENGNAQILNDTLSNTSEQLLDKIVSDFKTIIPLCGEVGVHDEARKSELEKEIEHLCKVVVELNGISDIKITPVIDSLLKSNNKRFGLITVAEGYTRTWENHDAQNGLQLAGHIAHDVSKGFIPYVPGRVTKASSSLYVMIVDAERKNIAFFRKNLRYCEPTDQNLLADQFRKIFEGFYF
jgi:hypothetical protein